MNYENRICCFIDILGFQGHVDETTKGDKDNVEKIKSIKQIIDIARMIVVDYDSGVSKSKMVTQFSDSIVISFKIEEKSEVFYTILDLLHIAFEFANKGYLARGGVCLGKMIHTDDFILGPALVDAYILESKKAVYPRIIVDAEVIAAGMIFKSDHHDIEFEKESILECLNKDDDGYYYIDFIEKVNFELDDPNYDLIPYLYNLETLIKAGLDSTDEKVVMKYNWLKEKYNSYIRQILHNIKDWKSIDDEYELLLAFKSLKPID
jgi:hypothetical protein